MVAAPMPRRASDYDGEYDELQQRWPDERPSRKKRVKREYRRRDGREVVVRSERRDEPDTARMSRALLAAQRELAQIEAEQAARRQGNGDGDT